MQKQKVSKLSKQQTLNIVRLNDVYAPENAPMDFLLDIVESKKGFIRSSAAQVISNDIMNSSNFNGNKIAAAMRSNKKAAAFCAKQSFTGEGSYYATILNSKSGGAFASCIAKMDSLIANQQAETRKSAQELSNSVAAKGTMME